MYNALDKIGMLFPVDAGACRPNFCYALGHFIQFNFTPTRENDYDKNWY